MYTVFNYVAILSTLVNWNTFKDTVRCINESHKLYLFTGIYTSLLVFVICAPRLIAQQLARLHSIDIAAVAAKFGDNVHIDREPSLFKSLYGWVEHGAFNSQDLQHQARFTVYDEHC